MIRAITTVLYVGLLRPAPGTWGSAATLPLAWGLHGLLGFPGLACATILITVLGVWAIDQAIAQGGAQDPPEIVIDEVAGQLIALWPVSAGLWFAGAAPWTFPWPGWVVAFLAFRLFDIWKPGPIGRAERLSGGWGVMADDLLAGFAAGVVVLVGAGLYHGLYHGVIQ